MSLSPGDQQGMEQGRNREGGKGPDLIQSAMLWKRVVLGQVP